MAKLDLRKQTDHDTELAADLASYRKALVCTGWTISLLAQANVPANHISPMPVRTPFLAGTEADFSQEEPLVIYSTDPEG